MIIVLSLAHCHKSGILVGREGRKRVSQMRYLQGLREARERALLTQEELAARSGVTVSTISRLENGLQAARISTIRKLAATIGTTADKLVDWDRPGPVMGGKGKAAA